MRYSDTSRELLLRFRDESIAAFVKSEGAEGAYIAYAKKYMRDILDEKGFSIGDLIQDIDGQKFYIDRIGIQWKTNEPVVYCATILKSGKRSKSSNWMLQDLTVLGAKKL